MGGTAQAKETSAALDKASTSAPSANTTLPTHPTEINRPAVSPARTARRPNNIKQAHSLKPPTRSVEPRIQPEPADTPESSAKGSNNEIASAPTGQSQLHTNRTAGGQAHILGAIEHEKKRKKRQGKVVPAKKPPKDVPRASQPSRPGHIKAIKPDIFIERPDLAIQENETEEAWAERLYDIYAQEDASLEDILNVYIALDAYAPSDRDARLAWNQRVKPGSYKTAKPVEDGEHYAEWLQKNAPYTAGIEKPFLQSPVFVGPDHKLYKKSMENFNRSRAAQLAAEFQDRAIVSAIGKAITKDGFGRTYDNIVRITGSPALFNQFIGTLISETRGKPEATANKSN